MEVRIVILNYNGEDLLPQCLPGIAEAAKRAASRTKITLLDNGSTDQGLAYAASHFPEAIIVYAPQNRVLCSYNDYLPQISEPVVILLNNDIRVDPGFVDPLVERFAKDPGTFLVSPQVMSFDGKRIEAGRNRAAIRWGLFSSDTRYPGYEREAGTASETYSSGFGAFSREKFLALGGYDDRFQPGIYEDVDLCLRAARRGWKLCYEPTSIVYHLGQASFKKKFGEEKIQVLAQRNRFLFMWKNFSGFRFWISHLFFLPFRIVFSLLRGKTALMKGFFEALQHRKSNQKRDSRASYA